ncbi:flagellar biosynthesis protein FlhF [Orrella sp. JC864]|uniref:flagellar biosynthesis protein FlhF n=1 Tax=Orrella sp. JC864 TaxID=3120298 RepID=UPI003008FFD4
MNISRFVGATSREVMRQVRLALGPDALIISNRRVNGGVEVMATDGTALPETAGAAGQPAAQPAGHPSPAVAPSDAPAPDRPAQDDLLGAITDLRGMLETRMDGLAWGEQLRRLPLAATLYRQLLSAGFSSALVKAMLQRMPEGLAHAQALAWARNELVTHLPMMRQEHDLWAQGGVFALVGPTGVGKTTTLAKLAARCVKREGAGRVLMITTDSYRIGAHEQLQIYGRLMGVPVIAVQDGQGLRQALLEAGGRHIVLVDNVGISQRDRQVGVQAAMLCGAGRPVRKLLVLNAASHGDTLDEVAHAYRSEHDELAGCIVTKLDEATQLGAALDTAIRHRLPVHYVSHGQKVPEHLALPSASELVDQALACIDTRRALYAPNEADLAALWSGTRPGSGGSLQEAGHQVRTRQLMLAALGVPAAGRPGLTPAGLDAALAWMASDVACARARESWRLQGQEHAAPQHWLQAQAGVIEQGYASHCRRQLLLMHGSTRLALREGKAVLAGTLAWGDTGTALVGTLQHLALAQASLANWPLAGQDTAQQRVGWFCERMPQVPMVHCFESDALLGAGLAGDARTAWLARCTPARRLVHEAAPTAAQAIAGPLVHAPLQAAPGPGAQACQAATLWAAETGVALGVRRLPQRLFRLVSVREVDDLSGRTLAQYYGLTNLEPDEADTACLAQWLALSESARACQRLTAQAWTALGAAQRPASQWLACSAAATQLALAAWQVRSAPQAEPVRQVLAHMLGGAQALASDRKLLAGLLRLYALMEMNPPVRQAA